MNANRILFKNQTDLANYLKVHSSRINKATIRGDLIRNYNNGKGYDCSTEPNKSYFLKCLSELSMKQPSPQNQALFTLENKKLSSTTSDKNTSQNKKLSSTTSDNPTQKTNAQNFMDAKSDRQENMRQDTISKKIKNLEAIKQLIRKDDVISGLNMTLTIFKGRINDIPALINSGISPQDAVTKTLNLIDKDCESFFLKLN